MNKSIYKEKGKEKIFYTLYEIADLSKKEAETIKEKRSTLNKLKHKVFKGNETVRDEFFNIISKYKKNLKDKKDTLNKASLLVETLKTVTTCILLKDFKENEFSDFFEERKTEYLNLCEEYIDNQFKNILQINIHHTEQALRTLENSGNNEAELKIKILPDIQNMVIFYPDFHSEISSLKYKYDSKKINHLYNGFSQLSHLENNDISAPFFSEIQKEILDVYGKINNKIISRIDKEKKRAFPSIKHLLKLYDEHIILECDFENFSEKYNCNKYNDERISLIDLLDKVNSESAKQENAFKKISGIKDPIHFMSEADKQRSLIDSVLDSMIPDYHEIRNGKKNLTEYQKKYTKLIKEKLTDFLKPIKLTLTDSSTESQEKQFRIWQDALSKANSLLLQIKDIHIAVIEINLLKENLISQIKEFSSKICKNFKVSDGEILLHIDLYELTLLNLEVTKDFTLINSLKKEKESLQEFNKHFYTHKETIKKILSSIEENLRDKDHGKTKQDIKAISEFLNKYKEHKYLKYKDIYRVFKNIETNIENYRKQIDGFWNSLAFLGTLVLFDPASEKRYVIFPKPKITIGRMKNNSSLIEDQRINIAWKRISAEHLQIDFAKGQITDLNSSNGTFINNKGIKDKDEKKTEDLEKINEFNLASDITFKLSYSKNDFSLFNFSRLTNENDLSFGEMQIIELIQFLKNTFFVYLPEDSSLKINKTNGKPTYQIGDRVNYYEIKTKNNKYYFTDWKNKIVDELILNSDNRNIFLLLEESV